MTRSHIRPSGEPTMRLQVKKALQQKSAIQMKHIQDKEQHLTRIRINSTVDVGTVDGWICFWVAGREVKIGPVTPDQAEKLSEDLGYDAVA